MSVSCDKIKELLPEYVQHFLSEQDTQVVEEHLCICQSCREHVGKLLDKEKESLLVSPREEKISFLQKENTPFIIVMVSIVSGLTLVLIYLLFKSG